MQIEPISEKSLLSIKKDKLTISLETQFGNTTFSCEEDNLGCINELLPIFTRFLKAADFEFCGRLVIEHKEE